jgi:hypothetical protein
MTHLPTIPAIVLNRVIGGACLYDFNRVIGGACLYDFSPWPGGDLVKIPPDNRNRVRIEDRGPEPAGNGLRPELRHRSILDELSHLRY